MRDYLNVHANRWEGMEIFRLYKDGQGNDFEQGPKTVCFDGGVLVGEYSNRTEAEKGFLRRDRVEGGMRKEAYLGLDETLRTYLWRP